jgi:XTP/dITP diphosphohydrolase
MKLVLASHNKNKVKEIKYLLDDFKIDVLSAGDLNLSEPDETGKTFEENALLKAKAGGLESGIICLADDSGFEVEAIENKPSIYSARWAVGGDYSKAFERIKLLLNEANSKLLSKGKPANNNAKFISVLCLYNPINDTNKFFRGEIEGEVVFPPRGENGFAYDTVFIPNGYNKTFAELSFEEKNSIAHRYIALQKLKAYFKESNIG